MADPKIKYDIEAAVKGEDDAAKLAKVLRDVGDVLEGDLKTSADAAAQALEALGSKQRAVDAFRALNTESRTLSGELDKAVGTVDRLGNELQESAAKTQAMAAAEKTAGAALAESQASLQRKRDALRTLREETTGAARREDEYRAQVTGLTAAIKAANAEVKERQQALRTAAQASGIAQSSEAALRKEYDVAIGAAARLSGELRNKNATLATARDTMQGLGLATNNLAQQERNLQTAVAQVRTEVAAMAPAYQQAAAASSRATQVQAQNQRTLRDGMQDLQSQLQRIQQIATIAIGGGFLGGLAKDVAATADEFKNLEARIKLVTGEGANFTTSFEGVKRVSLDTNSALAETGDLFTRLARASQESGMAAEQAQARALGLTQTINQAMQLSGGSAESAKAALTQLIQGLQSGVLRGEEFNSVMEQAPRLAQALANGLQVTTGELRNMANQGQLTADVVMKALEGQSDAVAREFGKLPPTMGRALQNLSSQWTIYVGKSDKGMVSSANAAKAIDALAQNLDTVVTTLTTAGKVWAAFKIASLAADFTTWATTTLTATKALEANTAAATANTLAQRANAAAQTERAAAQAASTAATVASTAAQKANATSWLDIASFLGGATAAQKASTAATAAGTVAVKGKTGALGMLGKGVAGVTRLLGGGVGLIVNLILFREEIAKGKDAVLNWAFSFTEAGKQLKAAEQELKKQEEAAKKNAEAAKAAAEAARLLAQRQEEAKNQSLDLTRKATGLIGEFDKLTKAGDSASEAIGKIGKNFDTSNVEGIRAMSAALNKLLADGKITAEEFRASWAKALDGQDLAKFEVLARNAFAAAGQEADKLRQQLNDAIRKGASEEVLADLRRRLGAAMQDAASEGERVATMMDQVLREAVRRTGLEYNQLQGKISAASRSAINDVEAIVAGMDRLKAEGVDTGRVLTASLGKAIQTADSQQAIDALRARVEQLRQVLGDKIADGLLDQLKDKALDLKDALDKATPGVNSLREAMKELGITSDATLKNTAAQAKAAYDAMTASGQASQRELSEGFKKTAEAIIAANNGVATEWVKSQAAVRGYKVEVDSAGKATLVAMKDGKGATDAVGAAARNAGAGFASMADKVTMAKDALRAMGIEADQVSEKVQNLIANGQMLAGAFQQRQDNRNRDLDASKYMNRGNTGPLDQVPTFNSREEAEAWKREWLEQWQRKNPFTTKLGMMGSYMKDAVMAEWNAEMDALNIRLAMQDAVKKPDSGGTPGGTPGGGSGAPSVDRIVNLYINTNSRGYGVPTNQTGQQQLEAFGRDFVAELENSKWLSGR